MSRSLALLCSLCGCLSGDPPPIVEATDTDASDGSSTGSTDASDTSGNTTDVMTDGGSSGSTGAASLEPWTITRDGSGHWHDSVQSIAIDPATGDVIVAGALAPGVQNRDPWLARFAPDGTEIWSIGFESPTEFDDSFAAVAIDNTGSIVVTGQIGREPIAPPEANADLLVARFNGDGTQAWVMELDVSNANLWDAGTGIALDNADSIFVSVSSSTPDEHINAFVFEIDPADGDVMWPYEYSGEAGDADFANAIAVTPTNEVCWTGSSNEVIDPPQADIVVGCVRNDGVELWTTTVPDTTWYDFGNAIAIGDDGIYVAGLMAAMGENTPKGWLGHFVNDGELAWSTTWGDGPGNAGRGIAIADDGDLWVTGWIGGDETDLFIGRWPGEGEPSWSEIVGEPGVGDRGLAIAVAPGRVVVGGFIAEAGQGENAWLRQLVP